jgi:acyl carrier protein
MTPQAIREQVFQALADVAPEADPASLDLTRPLRDQVDIDSFDYLNFIIGLSDRLGVTVPEADYGSIGTLTRLVDYLAQRTPR